MKKSNEPRSPGGRESVEVEKLTRRELVGRDTVRVDRAVECIRGSRVK